MMNMRYIYFGTDAFSVTVLDALQPQVGQPCAVVTRPDQKKGRGLEMAPSPVAEYAALHALPVLKPARLDASALMDLRSYGADFFCVVSYGALIPSTIFSLPPLGTVNLHPSLLPRYRGASPIQAAILHGDSETGVTVMLLDEQLDHGPILAQSRVPIMPSETAETLRTRLSREGAALLEKTIPRWVSGSLVPTPQDDAEASVTKIISKEDGHVQWSLTAHAIERHVRAMIPWPGSWTVWQHARPVLLKVLSARASSELSDAAHGTVLRCDEGEVAIACNQSTLHVRMLQREGKRPMSAREFCNGSPEIIGAVLQ